MTTSLAIILAAGQGTRMRSSRPKVMHEIGRQPMLWHVLKAAGAADVSRLALIVGPDSEDMAASVTKAFPACTSFEQRERLGTGHAVLSAEAAITDDIDKVVVLYGDVPLIAPATISAMLARLDEADLAVLGFEAANPSGYGRLITAGGELLAIREEKDATEEEKRIITCNSGLMAFRAAGAVAALKSLSNRNAQGEYYLTDLVEIFRASGRKVSAVSADAEEVGGVNTRAQLADAEAIFQTRRRQEMMEKGVTLLDPSTVYFSADTEIAPDVLIEQNVVFGPGVSVESGATIRAFCYLEGAQVGLRATVGPYARLREGTELGKSAKVGNFVETKKAKVGEGAKINHLSYIGDAFVGAEANIGAGTITCNYDGFLKYETHIGRGAFIGSNSSLIAPVNIAEGAIVGSGSVIVSDVAEDALAVARGRQVDKPGWAEAFRMRKIKEKDEKR